MGSKRNKAKAKQARDHIFRKLRIGSNKNKAEVNQAREHIFRKLRKRSKKKKAVVKQARDRTVLPHDAIVEILLHLPTKSLARFRCVCKLWNFLTYDPTFVNAPQRRRAMDKSITFLKYAPRYHKNLVIISRLGLDGKFIDEFTIMTDFGHKFCRLSNFANGLTCIYGSSSIYLLNPRTREYVMLPKINPNNPDEATRDVCLGFSTHTSEYKVIRKSFVESLNRVVWEILTVGTNVWRPIQQVPDEISLPVHLPTPIFLHGALHWRVEDKNTSRGVLSFDMNDEAFKFITECGKEQWGTDPFVFLNLLGLDDHLGLVTRNKESDLVEIWKLDDYTKSIWVIEDIMYLLPPETRFWVIGFHDGNLLIRISGQGLSSYDPRKKTFSKLQYDNNGGSAFFHTETNVSPKMLGVPHNIRTLGRGEVQK